MSKHSAVLRVSAGIVAILLTVPMIALAAGGSSTSSSSTTASVPRDPQAIAKDSYNRALKYRDKAWEYEAKAAAAEGTDREKFMKKAGKEFEKALRALDTAVESDPRLYQAHSSRGYVLRKTGDYEESLAAYNRALEINPRYAEAIEYRAEAYLGLNRIAEAKEAYMELFRTDRKRADELMEAMQGWVEAREADAAGVEASVLADFSGWVAERSGLADQTADSSGGSW
jgi:tetratricopeptide (TPR) repeat protein